MEPTNGPCLHRLLSVDAALDDIQRRMPSSLHVSSSSPSSSSSSSSSAHPLLRSSSVAATIVSSSPNSLPSPSSSSSSSKRKHPQFTAVNTDQQVPKRRTSISDPSLIARPPFPRRNMSEKRNLENFPDPKIRLFPGHTGQVQVPRGALLPLPRSMSGSFCGAVGLVSISGESSGSNPDRCISIPGQLRQTSSTTPASDMAASSAQAVPSSPGGSHDTTTDLERTASLPGSMIVSHGFGSMSKSAGGRLSADGTASRNLPRDPFCSGPACGPPSPSIVPSRKLPHCSSSAVALPSASPVCAPVCMPMRSASIDSGGRTHMDPTLQACPPRSSSSQFLSEGDSWPGSASNPPPPHSDSLHASDHPLPPVRSNSIDSRLPQLQSNLGGAMHDEGAPMSPQSRQGRILSRVEKWHERIGQAMLRMKGGAGSGTQTYQAKHAGTQAQHAAGPHATQETGDGVHAGVFTRHLSLDRAMVPKR